MSVFKLRSYEFRKERENGWKELENLVERVERSGIRSLDPEELVRLPELYRAALSALSVSRSISLDKNLIDYLEALSRRAYVDRWEKLRRLPCIWWRATRSNGSAL